VSESGGGRVPPTVVRGKPPGQKRAVARDVLRELSARAHPERVAALRRFFKTGKGEYAEGDRFLGLTVPDVRAVVRQYAALPLPEIVTLLRSPWHEARLAALLILVRRHQRGTPRERQAIARLYLQNTTRVNNWDLVDCSAGYIVGAHVDRGDRRVLARLARSPLVWDRRIAVMATFPFIRRGQFDDTLRIVGMLIDDRHDLIHKACGWMLREVGKVDRAVEERFLRAHAAHMPRTMLRYAIERFPPRLRARYLGAAGRRRAGASRAPGG
jgi:3-methyladenine DNA glycosylase AlkD